MKIPVYYRAILWGISAVSFAVAFSFAWEFFFRFVVEYGTKIVVEVLKSEGVIP